MSDNLPDINFKEKPDKEKKGGPIGWLKNKLGFGSRGAIGEAGVNPAAMNFGKAGAFGARGAIGAGKFGAAAAGRGGLAALLAGKGSMIATVAMVAVAGGAYLASNYNPPSNNAAFSSERSGDTGYVPAILRHQAANSGSSLDMFKETNKGSLSMEEEAKKKEQAPEEKPKDAAAEQSADPNAGMPNVGQDMAQDMAAKLQGSMGGSLTSQLGGGGSKFSNMGGFGNKFNSGAVGGKTGFSSGIGAGFSSMPKFDSRKGKMLAMKGSARPVFGGSKSSAKKPIGAGAFGQAKGMKAMQSSYSGSSADGLRSTQDKAWEGATGEGSPSGGAGVGDGVGGAGVMTSPSLDNPSGGGGGTTTPDTPTVPDASGPLNVSPWSSLTMMAMMMILMSAMLSAIGATLIKIGDQLLKTPYTAAAGAAIRGIGMLMAGIALALGIAATVMGMMIMQQHGQQQMGILYTIGGGVATAAAGMAMAGVNLGPITPAWMAAGAAVIALIGSMLGMK